jgi:hypothetical protein
MGRCTGEHVQVEIRPSQPVGSGSSSTIMMSTMRENGTEASVMVEEFMFTWTVRC